MRSLSEVEKAYWAGIIDGEGCVSGTPYAGDGTVPAVAVAVQMCEKDLPQALYSLYGGTLHCREHKKDPVKNRALWCWRVQGSGCKEFLEAIYPYLRLKKESAALVLTFLSLQEAWGHRKLSEDELGRRLYIVERLQSLTAVGRRLAREAETETLNEVEEGG